MFTQNSFRTVLTVGLAVALIGCTRDTPAPNDPLTPQFDATRTPMTFTIGKLATGGLERFFPDGRLHFRDIMLSGPVSGDLTGQTNILLNANLDRIGGSGPAWGSITITTAAGDVWEGNVTGGFVTGAPGPGIQLFASVSLRGPDNEVLKADCTETSATSEILICSGNIL